MPISHALVLLSLLPLSGSAMAQDVQRQIGLLTCTAEEVFSTPPAMVRPMRCSFAPTATGPTVSLVGKIQKFAANEMPLGQQVFVWSVLSDKAKFAGESLEGSYTNEGQSPITPVGQLLIGGVQGKVTLQPETQDADDGVNAVKTVIELVLAPNRI